MDLRELSKRHNEWYRMAISICHDKDTAADIVQDMYLKCHSIDKPINAGYIWLVMRSIYINDIRKQSPLIDIEIQSLHLISDNDIEAPLLHQVLDAMESLRPIEKIIVEGEYTKGQKAFSEATGISKHIIRTKRNKAIEKIKTKLWEQRNHRDI